jgi:hypothetical protein
LTPRSGSFFEFREPGFLWGGARFGAEVAASDFIGFCLSQVGVGDKTKLTELKGGAMTYVPTNFLL